MRNAIIWIAAGIACAYWFGFIGFENSAMAVLTAHILTGIDLKP